MWYTMRIYIRKNWRIGRIQRIQYFCPHPTFVLNVASLAGRPVPDVFHVGHARRRNPGTAAPTQQAALIFVGPRQRGQAARRASSTLLPGSHAPRPGSPRLRWLLLRRQSLLLKFRSPGVPTIKNLRYYRNSANNQIEFSKIKIPKYCFCFSNVIRCIWSET